MIECAEIFKNHLFEALAELSDRDFQERIWANKDNPEGWVTSFTEAAIQFWDDSLLSDALGRDAIIYDQRVTVALQELWNAIEPLEEYGRRPMEVINDPKMEIVRQKASEVLKLIESSDKSENTVTFLEEGTLQVLQP
ncbi:MAG: hypothetical protein MK052_04210 [Alphaproteobacteria bacterium]|nr:hypothetical protein [Alphaproteobacteria bacterium]